jgi:hypothetical protein
MRDHRKGRAMMCRLGAARGGGGARNRVGRRLRPRADRHRSTDPHRHGGFECETRGVRGDFSSIMRGALALASNDAPARSRTVEDGCVDLAGHLPLPHAPPLAGRAKDRKLALGGAHAHAYGHAGAVDGVRPDPSPPAPARAMVTADATKRTPRVERPRNRAYTVNWELERKSPRLTTRLPSRPFRQSLSFSGPRPIAVTHRRASCAGADDARRSAAGRAAAQSRARQ